MPSQKILITGGNGNLAQLLIAKLRDQGHETTCLDVSETDEAKRLAGVDYRCSDIRDRDFLDTLLSEKKPDLIIHLASLLSGSSEVDREMAWDINATSCFALFELCLKHGIEGFLFPGTAASYGENISDPLSQNHPQWPSNIYGVTKVACERLGVYYKLKHGLDFRCLRLPMVLSPWAPTNALTAYASSAFRAAAAGAHFSFPVSRNTGMSTIFINDVVNSFLQLGFANKGSLREHAYNLHGFHPTAEDFAKEITKLRPEFSNDFKPIEEVESLVSAWPSQIDDSTARRDWRWQPEFDIASASKSMMGMLI